MSDLPYDPDKPTLRDQFAMAALTVVLERATWPVDKVSVSRLAYDIADKMMAERTRDKPKD